MPESTLEELVTHEHHWDGAAGGVDGPPHARLRARMPLASPPNPVHKVPVQLALAVTLPVFATPNLIGAWHGPARTGKAQRRVSCAWLRAWRSPHVLILDCRLLYLQTSTHLILDRCGTTYT